MDNKSELIIYTTEDGLTKVDVTFDNDTVWLSLDQMAALFLWFRKMTVWPII